MREKYNDDNTNRGVEGWTELLNGKLIVFIKSTNSKADWLSNLNAFRSNDILANCKVHSGYKMYARWMHCFIVKKATLHNLNPEDIIIIGSSMGGGIAQILGEYNNFKIISIDGPRTTSRITNNKDILYYNRGSIVHNIPFWFKRISNAISLNSKWRPFWKAHVDYNIEEIITEVTE